MATYSEQVSAIRSLPLIAGVNKRFDCPFCGGRMTLSVKSDRGSLQWHCFKASCGSHGRSDQARSASELRASLKPVVTSTDTPCFVLPEALVPVATNERAMAFLQTNHCLGAYKAGRVAVRYDPKRDRVVFILKEHGKPVDAVGRSLCNEKPKWLRYGASHNPFVVGDSPIAVVVEDVASACAVSSLATGIALMGTNLLSSAIPRLTCYDKIIIALDPDARGKALKLQQQLSYYVPTTVRFIADDLKYFPVSAIAHMLELQTNSETNSGDIL